MNSVHSCVAGPWTKRNVFIACREWPSNYSFGPSGIGNSRGNPAGVPGVGDAAMVIRTGAAPLAVAAAAVTVGKRPPAGRLLRPRYGRKLVALGRLLYTLDRWHTVGVGVSVGVIKFLSFADTRTIYFGRSSTCLPRRVVHYNSVWDARFRSFLLLFTLTTTTLKLCVVANDYIFL